MSTRSLSTLLIIFSLLILSSAKLSLPSLKLQHSNQGYTTDYLFQFTPEYPYKSSTIRIGFPIDFILSDFQQELDCYTSESGHSNDFEWSDCWIEPSAASNRYFLVGDVVVQTNSITEDVPFFVLLRNIANPIQRDLTSYFSLCIELANTLIQCENTFARALLTPLAPLYVNSTATFSSSPLTLVVGQATTYIFTVPIDSLGTWYSDMQYLSIRAIFPEQFKSSDPHCSLAYRLSNTVTTYVPFEAQAFESRSNVIECLKINNFTKYIESSSIKIQIRTILNPLQEKLWFGVKFELVRSIHNEVQQLSSLAGNINVVMEAFKCDKLQTNFFRNATTEYFLYLNHDIILSEGSTLQITIGNGSYWNIHNLKVMFGFTSPNTTKFTIFETSTKSVVILSNFGIAPRQIRQGISINLTSPIKTGYHFVSILAKISNKKVGYWQGSFFINQTYGEASLLSLSAIKKRNRLEAGATGPLELTFFLNYQLPQSDGLKNGSIQLSISPQLQSLQSDVNGVLKCYFKATYQASNCTLDNSDPTKSKIILVSPPLEIFQYSELPIIITTQGAIDDNHTGFPIDPTVTRYLFQTQFYLYNSSTIPSEVYYSEWIANPLQMSTATIRSLTYECGEETQLLLSFVVPFLSTNSLTKDLRLIIQFLSHPITKVNAWHPALGYQTEKIYKQYPCLVSGLTGTRISCDLYTYHANSQKQPYNSLAIKTDFTGPFFIIYGFQNTGLIGSTVKIYLPKIKIGSQPNIEARVRLTIIEETPAQLQPYVQLYFQNITAFKTLPGISIGLTSVNSSQSNLLPVQTMQQYNISWTAMNSPLVSFIKYQISSLYFPSFQTKLGSCSNQICRSYKLFANWIVQDVASPFTNPHTACTLSNFIATIPFVDSVKQSIPIYITTYDSFGNTIDKVFMTHDYTPQAIVGYFDFLQPTYYAGLPQWYSISFSNAPVTVSEYPFVQVKLTADVIFSSPLQCNSTTLLPFNASGVQFKLTANSTIVIYNIQKIVPSGTYQFNCRLKTISSKYTSMVSPSFQLQLHHNYSISPSLVGLTPQVILQQAPILPNKAAPHLFTIDNPQIINQLPRVNYIGSLLIDFTFSDNNIPLNGSMDIILENHIYNKAGWSTPTTSNSDPPVCLLNKKRQDCSWKNNPLKIYIDDPKLKFGKNTIQITSQYVAPENGVKFPGAAGEYLISIILKSANSTKMAQNSFYTTILPPDLLHFQASSIVKDVGTESVYMVNFTYPTWLTSANSHADSVNYSRIFIEFPTQINGNQIFLPNLGGYNGYLNERIGCSFMIGTPYLSSIPGKELQCRFIPAQFDGGRVKVEIINHSGLNTILNSMSVLIYKIVNPALAYSSVDIWVSIKNYEVGTGHIYPLYSSKYTIFLDPYPKNLNPIQVNSIDDPTIVPFFEPLKTVGQYGYITLTAQTSTSILPSDPYYVIFKLPQFLSPESIQLTNQVSPPFPLCSTTLFEFCTTSREIQYVLVKVKASPAILRVNIRNFPTSISQKDTVFTAMIIQQGRYTANIVYNISSSFRWKALAGTFIAFSITLEGSLLKADRGREKTPLLISFRPKSIIPITGTIEIVFPSSVTKIYPHCRSAIGMGSTLSSSSGLGPLGPNGEIGCAVQNGNHWVITNFQQILNSSLITIRGEIDLPNIIGTLGTGQIISYTNTHSTDIFRNGAPIDYLSTAFTLIISSTQAMNINSDLFLTQRSVLRQNTVGQFRYLFSLSQSLLPEQYIELSLYKTDIKYKYGGFSLSLACPKVCEFIRIDNQERIGCYVESQTETFIFHHEVIMYKVKTTQNLLAGIVYQVRLTSQCYSSPEGISYPSQAGTFKIDFLTNHTSTSLILLEQKYIEVVGLPFNHLILTQFNFEASYYSPFWLQIAPSVPLDIEKQLIIQFPTISNDGSTRLFLDDLGWTSAGNGGKIPIDMFDCSLPNTFMSCRVIYGSYLEKRPAKIICGNLLTPIAVGQIVKFAFSITNPVPLTTAALSQLSLPVFVYAYDPVQFRKINFNTINVGVVINNANKTAVPNSYFSTDKNQLQTPNERFKMSRYNTLPLAVKDFYVIKFNFPLRVNDKKLTSCTDNFGAVIGTIYYHQNLQTVVCLITSGLAANTAPTFANLYLTSFYTPWYGLNTTERVVLGIASYQKQFQSDVVDYFDPFPLFPPRTLGFLPQPIFTLTPVLAHNQRCQLNDYIFKVQLQSSASTNTNLQNTKQVIIYMPSASLSDFSASNTDCMEYYLSQIEVSACRIDIPSRSIIVDIVPKPYTNGKMLYIISQNLAIQNPCSTFSWNSWNSMEWSVQFLSSENGNALTPYMLINSGNMAPTSLSIDYQNSVSSLYTYSPFTWFQVPYQRYYNQFLQFKSGQYSPFSFEFQLTTAVPATTYNKLRIQFGSNYIPCGTQIYIDELSIFTPVCYLFNTRIQRCFVDTSANTTTMQFDFNLPTNTKIHAYFSVIDPRNPHLNGYSYIGGEDLNRLQIKLETGATTYLFQTPNFQAYQSLIPPIGLLPVRGITYGTIDYSNNVGGQLNVLDMKFDVSRNDIKALKFEIPTVDEYNSPIFGGSYSSSFFGLNNGDEYPCGNNQVGITQTASHKCYIFFGKETLLGSPVEIIMTPLNQGASINARILLINPNIHGMSLSIKIKAYTGIQDTRSIYGGEMIGSWTFSNIFKINSVGITSGSYDASTYWTTYLSPNRYLWRELTTWTLNSGIPFWPSSVLFGDYVIMQVLLSQWNNGEPDDQVCRVNFPFGNTRSDDMIMLKHKQSRYEKAFFVKKWTGGSWFIDYFKCKHLKNRIKVWYSYLQTSVTTVDYTFAYYYPYYPAVGNALFIDYLYFFPLDQRTYVEIDVTSAINNIIGQGFIWDKDVLYNLVVSYSYLGPTPLKCIVAQGIENRNLKMPVKCTYGYSTFTLTGFTQILLNSRLGRYRIKIQLQHSSYSLYTSYLSYSYTVSMYAHQSSPGSTWNDWYIFTASSSTNNLFMAYLPSIDYCWIGIGCPAIYAPVGYSHYKPRPSNDFDPGLVFYGMNAGLNTIQFRMNLRPKASTTISMSTAGYTYSYPQFRFLFNNYIFTCSTINRFVVRLHRWGNVYPLDLSTNPNGIITCARPSQITLNFYYYMKTAEWGSIWGVEGPSPWGNDITLQFDVQFSIIGQIQPIYYRDWLSISAYVDLFQYKGPSSSCSGGCGCYTTCGSSCLYHTASCISNTNTNKYSSIQNTIAYSEEFWEPFPLLFGAVTLSPLSDVIGQSTEMKITLSNYQLSIGPSFGKVLLLQIDQNINPFTYLNSSNLLMNRLQCKCQTSSTPNQPTDRICYFRNTLLSSGQPSSITIQLVLTQGMDAICYFPQWKIFAGALSITAKLINDYAGFPTYTTYTASNLTASYYKTASIPLTFTNNVAPSTTLTLAEDSNPSIYSPTSYVNTIQSDYTLRITAPQTLAQPIVYIDFQKGGIIPDVRLCNNTFFLYCRVYTTYRHILVAKFKLTYSSGSDMLIDSNFLFTTSLPKHWEYGTDSEYHLIVKLLGSPTSYTHKANINRLAAKLLPLPINCTVEPERSTGTPTATMDTNIILNFDITNQTLLSYYSGKGRINITCSDSTIFSTIRGCTVFSVTHPLSSFYCEIRNNILSIQNKHFTNSYASNGLLQVIIGLKNPSVPITFTVTGYQYDYSDYPGPQLNYAILFQGTAIYTPKVYTGVTLTQPNQLKMYPFNTKIFSDTDAPFRVAFKVTSTATYPFQYIIVNNLLHLGPFTKFQCLVREFPSDPSFKLQTIFPNSYRNYKQTTQHNQFYVKCYTVAAGLQVQVPGNNGLSSSLFYELAIMPAGTTQTGFSNIADPLFKFIIHPSPNERIDQVYQYIPNSFTLTSIKVVSKRPLSTTAILIDFNINNSNPSNYPQHYFEVLFRDIDVSSLKAIYKVPGTKVPCTLSALFLPVTVRTQLPLCNVQLQEVVLNTIIVRITQIGNIAAGSYRLTFDDFKLPSMITPQLENSSPFTLCMKIHNFVATSHYQRCFDEVFIIDYQTNILAPSVNTGAMTVSDLESGATNVIGTINVPNYPMSSTSSLHQKIMIRVNNGYQSIDSKFILNSYTLLWSSPMAHLYIYQQNTVALNSPQAFTFSNLTNPVSSQKNIYTSSPTMDLTWINGYHPISQQVFTQPLSAAFTLKPARIYATSILYNNDIKQAIPYDSSFIYKMQIVIEDSSIQIAQKQIEKVQIDFGNSVSLIQRCWIQSQPSGDPYLKDGDCLVQSTRRLLLPSMNKAFANNNSLTLYLQMQISSNIITYNTSVFCTNKELQYFSSNSQFFIDVNNSQSLYSFIDFTPNLYTPYYYELITQVSLNSLVNSLYFGFKLPADLIHATSVFTIQLPATIFPSNKTIQSNLKCQWLTTDKSLRRFLTGKHSVCSFSGVNLIIQAPYAGLSRLDSSNNPIFYILKIRQINIIGTNFAMPSTATPLQLIFTYQNGATILQDTLLVQPYALFNGLSINPSTLTISELNTYTIQFAPSSAFSISTVTGNEAILELSIDHRYMQSSLGLSQLFKDYGTNTNNQTWIDNSGLNVAYSILPNQWSNGLPYSGWTSTSSRAQQTSLHEDSSRFRVLLTHQNTFSGTYIWKIPLLKNPMSVDLPYRMNLTLFTIWAGTSVPQKELFYQIINPYRTFSNSSSLLTYNFTTNAFNSIQSSSSSIDVDFGFPFIPNTLSVAQFKFSQRGAGIIGLTNFLTNNYLDSSYTFYFFKRLNLIHAHKTINDSSTTIKFGQLQTSNKFVDYYGYDWVKVHSSSSLQTQWNAGSLHQALSPCQITTANSLLLEGIPSSAGSQFLYKFWFVTSCSIPINSTVLFTKNNNQYQWSRQSSCYSSFRSMGCKNINDNLQISVDENIATGTILNFEIYLQSSATTFVTTNLTITAKIYGLPQLPQTTIINIPLLAAMPDVLNSSIFGGSTQEIVFKPLYQNTFMTLWGRVKPQFSPVNYIKINHPFIWTPNSHHRFLYRLNDSSLLKQQWPLKWKQSIIDPLPSNIQTFSMPPSSLIDYSIDIDKQYTFLLSSTYDPIKQNNLSIGAVGSYYNFIYESAIELAYQEVYPLPVSKTLTLILPTKQVSYSIAMGIRFIVPSQSILLGDYIDIILDSHNLVRDMYIKTSKLVQCAQGIIGILQSTSILACEVNQYPSNGNPMIIRVFPSKTVTPGTAIEIWISPILNPKDVMIAGVILKVTRYCFGQYRCMIYEARGYYKTVNNLAVTNYQDTVATFSPSNTQVYKTPVVHTYTFTTQTVTAAIFDYPENYDQTMNPTCNAASAQCIVFPGQNRVVLVPTLPTSISSLQLQSMRNGRHIAPQTQFINLTVCTSLTIDNYNVPHKNLTTIRTIPTTLAATSMSITPTQSPFFLRNYMNTAVIKIKGIFTQPFISAFHIHAPSDIVTWDKAYCNSTLTAGGNNPYPVRLNCSTINDTTLSILVPQGVIYTAMMDSYFIQINCKFKIKDFPLGTDTLYVSGPITSGTFNAYGSYSGVDDYHYYVTQASQTILISQHKIPQIGKVEFSQQSYAERLANINQDVYFDMLYDPATTQKIAVIELQVPNQFGYPAVGDHDACQMLSSTSLPFVSCTQQRRNGRTYLRMVPPSNYDNSPVIITFANQNYSNWFKAPSLSGYWYNFTLSTYAQDGKLLQRQYTENCSYIGGYELNEKKIWIQNGKDEFQEEIVDISFVVGKQAILQGYPQGLLDGSFYTRIQISFQNWDAFPNIFTLSNIDGEYIGCSTRNLISNQQIKCRLDIGNDIEHQPKILVQGYEQIPSNTNVTISLAKIQMLSKTKRNVAYVGVQLYRVGSWKQSYLYDPRQLLLKQTSALSITPYLFLDIGYVGLNIVGSSCIFFIAFKPAVDITSFITIKFPSGFLSRQYGKFATNSSQGIVELFTRSDTIRIYPNNGIHNGGVLINYTITGFPSASRVFPLKNWPIKFQAYSTYKQIHAQTFNLGFESYPCKFNFSLITASSLYIYDTTVSYTFQATLPIFQGSSQTFSLQIPSEYPSLLSEGIKFSITPSLDYSILSANTIQINQTQKAQGRILITINGITNSANLSHTFFAATYSGNNLDALQCTSSAIVTLRPIPQQQCQFTVSLSHYSVSLPARYTFSILCPQTIRNSSTIKIALSPNYLLNNKIGPLTCWGANPLDLAAGNCELSYENATVFVNFKNIRTQLNQASVILSAIINNSVVAKDENFYSLSTINKDIYARTNSITISFYSNPITKITSISMYNIPQAGGSRSIYALKLPTKFISSGIQVDFPKPYDLSKNVRCSIIFSNNSRQLQSLSYFDLLQLSYSKEISCTFSISIGRHSSLLAATTFSFTEVWAFLVLRHITNPSYWDPSVPFSVRSLNTQKQLVSLYEGGLDVKIGIPSNSIHMVGFQTGESDLVMLTTFKLSYSIDTAIFTNATSLVLTPPEAQISLQAVESLYCCLLINDVQIECHLCRIGLKQIEFTINTQGLMLLPDDILSLQITQLYTPDLLNKCESLQDYLRSYFQLLVFRNGSTLTHSSIEPSADRFTPCKVFTPTRGDLLFAPPTEVYAGLSYQIPLTVSRPSKMLRIFLRSPSFDITFTPSLVYINSYDISSIPTYLNVDPDASTYNTVVQLSHEQSIVYNLLRDNRPSKIKIRNDTQQFVEVKQSQHFSVGQWVKIAVQLTHIASYDIYLTFSFDEGFILPLQIEESTILIPARSKTSFFSVRYSGDFVPPTIKLGLQLTSAHRLRHSLRPQIIYFFFSVTPQFQTLPPVMKFSVLHTYSNNSQYQGRKIYNQQVTGILYDQLLPYIIKIENISIGATAASLRIFTRREATVHYVILQRGQKFSNVTAKAIRNHQQSNIISTSRNSSHYVNVYGILNLRRLQHQTIYCIYAMASDQFGDSTNYVKNCIQTVPLTNAVEIRIDTLNVSENSVRLVHALSDVLDIDILRVKDIDSYVIQRRVYIRDQKYQNQLLQRNTFVISPSSIEQLPTPWQLTNSILINKEEGRKKLKTLLPQFYDNFKERISASSAEDQPITLKVINLPKIKYPPKIISISYYSATLSFQLWEKANVFALAVPRGTKQTLSVISALHTKFIEGSRVTNLTDDIPYSKQIIRGKDSFNQNISNHISGITNDKGFAQLSFNQLNPGTQYDIYITFTTIWPFEPVLYANTEDIYQIAITTLENPNIKNNDEALIIRQLKSIDPQLYQIIKRNKAIRSSIKNIS